MALVDVTLRGAADAHQSFMNEPGDLQRVIVALMRHVLVRQPPQFAIDDRLQLRRRQLASVMPTGVDELS